jgi:hypothetical protein
VLRRRASERGVVEARGEHGEVERRFGGEEVVHLDGELAGAGRRRLRDRLAGVHAASDRGPEAVGRPTGCGFLIVRKADRLGQVAE